MQNEKDLEVPQRVLLKPTLNEQSNFDTFNLFSKWCHIAIIPIIVNDLFVKVVMVWCYTSKAFRTFKILVSFLKKVEKM